MRIMNYVHACLLRNRILDFFVIVAIYVDDMYLIGTLEEFEKTASHLKSKFETKDLEKNSALSWHGARALCRWYFGPPI